MERVFITGAGSGIGRATALEFAKQKCGLVLTDIDPDAVHRVAEEARSLGGEIVDSVALDVSDSEAMRAFAKKCDKSGVSLSVIVNNAGIGAAGSFLDTSLDSWERVLSINLMGVVHGCHFFAPQLVKRGRGHIVNIASVLGLIGLPNVSSYAASKFAVVGLSQSLAAEFHSKGVSVTAICPGLISTDIIDHAEMSGSESLEGREKLSSFFRKRGTSPAAVASAIVRSVRRGKSGIVTVPAQAGALHLTQRFAPRLLSFVARKGNKVNKLFS